jgi:hypothetical protein
MNKNKLIDKLMSDMRIISPDYQPKKGENIIQAYIGGLVPIMFASKTMTQKDFDRIC